MPKEKLVVSIADQYESLEQFIEHRHRLSEMNKVQFEIGFIIFDDGTAWAGQFMKADPNKPGRYIPIATAN
jgi:hypothetical protein